jgi:hypothetical protein
MIGLHEDVGGSSFQRRLDVEFCALNGISAAGTACRELSSFLNSLLNPTEGDHNPYQNHDYDTEKHLLGLEHLEMDAKSRSMIQLAHEEFLRSSEAYDQRLESRIAETLQSHSHCLVLLRGFLEHENYELATSTISDAESDERLERDMMGPLRSSPFLQQLSGSLQADVCWKVGEEISRAIVENVIFHVLWVDGQDHGHAQSTKRFTDLGALLLAKQVRMLQGFISEVATDPETRIASSTAAAVAPAISVLPNFVLWERLSQVLTALQLEKPSDWLAYSYHSSSSLSPDELRRTFLLRVDFSADAVNAVVAQVSRKAL